MHPIVIISVVLSVTLQDIIDFTRVHSQKSLGFSEIVLKEKFAFKCYEALLYTSMD